jgi:hypothetical protein
MPIITKVAISKLVAIIAHAREPIAEGGEKYMERQCGLVARLFPGGGEDC